MKNVCRVLCFKPTQFAVGMLEVDEKIKVVSKFTKKQRRRYVKETPVPTIHGPDGQFYVVDHHHYLCVCYHVGIEKVRISIIKDFSKSRMTYSSFWRWMMKIGNPIPFANSEKAPVTNSIYPKTFEDLLTTRTAAWPGLCERQVHLQWHCAKNDLIS